MAEDYSQTESSATLKAKGGWMKLHYTIKDWQWYKSPHCAHLFVHLILCASYKTQFAPDGTKLERGQLLTSLDALSSQTGLSKQMVRDRLAKFERSGEIALKRTHRHTIITICNFSFYQDEESPENTLRTQSEHSENTIQESKDTKESKDNNLNTPLNPPKGKARKVKPSFNPTGKEKYLDHVYLSDKQFEEVRDYYVSHGLDEPDFWVAVRELDTWFENNPGKRAVRTNDAKALKGWPMQRAIQLKADQAKLKRSLQPVVYTNGRAR